MPLRRTRGRSQDYSLKKSLDQEDLDIDEDLDEEVTRCICGNEELNTDDSSVDTGFFIQCENCSVWQHGYCVGIKDTADSPEKYWCEQCKPELHALIENGTKSLYIPVNGEVKVEDDPPESLKETEPANQSAPEESDSRDQNETKDTKDAKEIKKNRDVKGSKDGKHSKESKETKDSKDAKEKISVKQEEARSRLSVRESRQLQQALELSAKESGVKPETIEVLERPRRTANSNGTEHTSDESEPSSNKRKNDAVVSNKKGKELKSKRLKSASSSSSSKESKKEDKKILQLNSEKPFKPKTHSSKISMIEMRKRIAGILEFIGRTQIEMANEENERAQLTKHLKDDADDEDTALKLKIETNLITSSKNTLTMMDSLTRKLLRWEQRFGAPG
ncbi:hypothetical protein LJB42_000300 [Komagataella kurtzmanii]|nr:hypothetical protein LJB42_000300 [Komagataella kurtzmanii]